MLANARARNRARRFGVVALLAVPTAAALPSCSGAPAASPATSSLPGEHAAAELGQLAHTVRLGRDATFKAVYTSSSSGGTQSVILEQAPPRQLFSTSGGPQGATEYVRTATTSYICATGESTVTICTDLGTQSAGGAIAGVVGVYDGAAALTTWSSWQPAGGSLTFSTSTVAGHPVQCVHRNAGGAAWTYCVTANGVLARVETPASDVTLIRLTTVAPIADFTPPPGATVVTLPAGKS